MKRSIAFFVFLTALVFTTTPLGAQMVNVEDQVSYCKEFANRGAEAEWGAGETTLFSEYYTSYREWYEICMDAHR